MQRRSAGSKATATEQPRETEWSGEVRTRAEEKPGEEGEGTLDERSPDLAISGGGAGTNGGRTDDRATAGSAGARG